MEFIYGSQGFYMTVRPALESAADGKYRAFHSGLVPGIHDFLGVRLPYLRKLGKKLSKELGSPSDWKQMLCETPFLYEEVMLRGILIGLMPDKVISALTEGTPGVSFFEIILSQVKYIDNWALCDCFCSGLKQNKLLDASFLESCAEKLILHGESVWHIRTGTDIMLSHYVTGEHISRVLELCREAVKRIAEFDYESTFYVRMGAAWLLSECYVKFPDAVSDFMFGEASRENIPDDWTFNRAIQKITESNRVSQGAKSEIRKKMRKEIRKHKNNVIEKKTVLD